MNGQIKKASSAVTPKASQQFKLISCGDKSMSNSTAVNLNNQVDQAYSMASDALDNITLAMEHIGGLEALFKSIYLQSRDKQGLKEILNASKLGCYVCDDFINSLDCQKESLVKHINALRGVNHE